MGLALRSIYTQRVKKHVCERHARYADKLILQKRQRRLSDFSFTKHEHFLMQNGNKLSIKRRSPFPKKHFYSEALLQEVRVHSAMPRHQPRGVGTLERRGLAALGRRTGQQERHNGPNLME